MSFNRYFVEELTALRELSREFSERNPSLAPFLGTVGRDPDVERLFEGALKNNGLYKYFDLFFSVSDLELDKNEPDTFDLAAKKMGVRTSDCLMFEDDYMAARAAKVSGMCVVGIVDEKSNEEELKKYTCMQAESFIQMHEKINILKVN